MLENFIEGKTTMQADEVGEVLKESVAFSSTDMTFNSSPPEVKEEPLVEEESSPTEDVSKYEGINLEDDIEKVEVTSQEESSSEEEEESEIIKTEERPPFSGIPTQNASESVKTWLQRITEMQNEIQKKYGRQEHLQMPATNTSSSSISSVSPIAPSRVVKYQDLPYMGEITLNNSKPRRGRKPKKADICHLIYKNYGTIFPGTPNPGSYLEKDTNVSKKNAAENKDGHDRESNRLDVQNRIISSLLEKRLTQDYNRNKDESKKNSESKENADQNEPLNLCIRDLNHLKIRLFKNTDNTYSQIKSEPPSDEDTEESTSPSVISKAELRFPPATPDSLSTPSPTPEGASGVTAPGGYVYWPNAGVFIHPVALQQQLMMYQRMNNSNNYILPNNHSPKPPPEQGSKQEHGGAELRKLVPKVVKPKLIYSKENVDETDSHSSHSQDLKKRSAPSGESKTPVKRKRSAIFIPPIPAENNTNPATEVSICKFKFTGGAKPSLQEKKMLSVDSGGNFRYYSGTGDKSMRGYEFFPRETLQQQITNTQGSSTGAFLQASGEKIYPAPPPEFAVFKGGPEFLLNQNLPVPGFSKSQTSTSDLNAQRLKKRKSRKSIQREKLEQTFKEKGFLIQTQQTENAEGATYCKFRQLRKFTRYLFRSWKDYLPGNITEGEQQAMIASSAENGEVSISQLPRDSNSNLSLPASDVTTNNAQ